MGPATTNQKQFNFDIVKTRVSAPAALLNYGKRILSLSEVYPFFGNKQLWKKNEGILREARPFWTKTHVAFSRLPLIESIREYEGKIFLVDRTDTMVWRFEIPKIFTNMAYASNTLFVIEDGYEFRKDGENAYTTLVTDANKVKCISIPGGWTKTGKHDILFGKGENLKVYFGTPNEEVKVGLVSVGNFGGLDYVSDFYHGVNTPFRSNARFRIPINAEDAKQM